MYAPPGAPPDHAEPQPYQQAVEPGEGEQPYSPEHTEAHCDTTHHMHYLWGYKPWLHGQKQSQYRNTFRWEEAYLSRNFNPAPPRNKDSEVSVKWSFWSSHSVSSSIDELSEVNYVLGGSSSAAAESGLQLINCCVTAAHVCDSFPREDNMSCRVWFINHKWLI